MKKELLIITTILVLAMVGCELGEQVKWEDFSDEKISEAAKLGKPAVAYFYAAWCGSCYQLKAKTFSDPEVIQALEHYARLKSDLSFIRSEASMEISRRYKIRGVPTVILFDSNGEPVKRFSGFVPAKQFLALLESMNPRIQAG